MVGWLGICFSLSLTSPEVVVRMKKLPRCGEKVLQRLDVGVGGGAARVQVLPERGDQVGDGRAAHRGLTPGKREKKLATVHRHLFNT